MPDGRTFQYSIITPERILAEGKAEFVAIPGHDGQFGVMHSRAPLLCKLTPGIVRVKHADEEEWFYVSGGFAHVFRNRLLVLAPKALTAEQVDKEQAEAALAEATSMKITDEASLRRRAEAIAAAKAMLKLAAFAVVTGRKSDAGRDL